MNWFTNLLPTSIRTDAKKSNKKGVPEGVWTKCQACAAVLYRSELERSLAVCPKCGFHHRLPARTRLIHFLDTDSPTTEIAATVQAVDRLKFRDSKRYKDRLSAAQKKTGEQEALLVMQGQLQQLPIVACAFEFSFMGGSMGTAVGERFVQGVNACLEQSLPLVCFSASGGARMQEGLFSLLQMAKTSAALKKLSQAQLPFISVLTDPTMGGVAASLAMLGDVIVAEPQAMVGFAGPRVIEQTVRQTLPEGFQRSEFLMTHGAIDMIVARSELRDKIASLLRKLLKKPAYDDQHAA